MLSARWSKVLRELWKNKTRTILVLLSIAVGVFSVGMIAGTQVVLSNDLTAAYQAINPASAVLYVDPFDDDLVQAVRGMKEVSEAEGRRNVSVRFAVDRINQAVGDSAATADKREEWRSFQLLAVPDYKNIRLNKFWPESGAWPPPDREMLLERAALDFAKAKVGDVIIVKTPSGKEREVRVAGTTHDIDQAPAFFSGNGVGYITFDTLEWLGEPRDYNELFITVADHPFDKEHIRQVADEVKSKVEKSGRTVHYTSIPDPGKHPADNTIQALLLLLGVLGLLALLLSGFLVVNTISALLAQQVRQIGIMKAVGARSNQIAQMYMGTVLLYGVLALALGIPLGAVGANAFTSYTASLLNFDLRNFRVPTEVLALEVAVGIIVPLLAALYPVISGTRITVREALSTYGLAGGRNGTGLVERALRAFRRIPGPLVLSLRNTFRRKGRLALTLVTLTLGGAIFIAVLSVRSSTMLTLDDALEYWKYDIQVNLSRAYRVEEIQQEALNVPGVAKAESWEAYTARRVRPDDSESNNLSIIAPPASTTMIQPTVLEGRWLVEGDENAIVVNTDLLREEPSIRVGDEIVLKIQGRESTWRVVGVVRGLLTGPIAYANYPYFARTIRQVDRAGFVVVETQQHDGAFEAQAAKALEDRFEQAGLRVSGKQTTADLRNMIQSQFNLIVVFLLIMAVLLAVVGALGLAGTMSINVLERTREIGVMRAIGAANGDLFRIVLVEGILIGLLSWLIGALVALPMSKLLSDAVGVSFVRAPLSYSFSLGGAFLWLVIVIVLSAVASFLPSWKASRLSVREVLSYE